MDQPMENSTSKVEDLKHETNNHLWLWNVSDIHGGAIVDQNEFVEAVQVRLGCRGPREPAVCEACKAVVMDGTGRHASTRTIGEATRGHNRCVETIFQYAKVIDPEAVMEPREIVPSQGRLRPADILSAAACRLTAADLGVTSPAVAESAEKAKDAMVARKTDERTNIENEMRRQGIHYQPMVASHFGSLHGDLDDWIRKLAKACGRKRGWATKAVEKQMRSRLGASLARRAARMSLATFGKKGDEGEVILPIVEYDELAVEVEEEGVEAGDEEEEKEEERGGTKEVGRPEWDDGPEEGWGAEHGWGLGEGDVPTFGWDTRRVRMTRPRVQALVDGELEFQ